MSYYLGPLLPVKLSKLKIADLDTFNAALRNGGGRGGRPLAVSTCGGVHSVVRAAPEQDVRWGWLRENPAARASPSTRTSSSPPITTPPRLASARKAWPHRHQPPIRSRGAPAAARREQVLRPALQECHLAELRTPPLTAPSTSHP